MITGQQQQQEERSKLLVGENEDTSRDNLERPKSWYEARDVHVEVPDYVKRGFIRKVYGLLLSQLAITTFISLCLMLITPAREWVVQNPWLIWLWFPLTLVSMCPLFAFQRLYPHNLICLFIFTFFESMIIGTVCAAYYEAGAGQAVAVAFVLTCGIVLALTVFTFVSQIDFSFLRMGLFVGLIALMFFGLIVMLVGWKLYFLYSLFGALLFIGFILYDTSQIINHLGCDDYVGATISLYLDVINLFVFILSLLGGDRR